MNEITSFELSMIDPNPFQTRDHEDAEHVQKLAASIRAVGLLQVPRGRGTASGRAELAFGHSRLAAYRLLAAEDAAFATFPVIIQNFTDIEMFELAVRENEERKELTPIEEARAMRTYRERFGKTTAEIGLLFGLPDSAVRNKLRLLELPEPVQPMVGREITEGTARRMLALKRVMPAEEMVELGASIRAGEVVSAEMVDEVLSDRLRQHAFEMRGKWNDEPRAADGLFRFDWKIPEGWTMPDLKKKDLEALGLTGHELSEEELEKQQILAAPPACNACPYHAVVNATHYCCLKLCFTRKKAVFILAELMRVSKETGIAIYDAEKDGKVFQEIHYLDDGDRKKILAAPADYRLKASGQSVYWTGLVEDSKWVLVLDVSADTVKRVAREKKARAKDEANREAQQSEWETQYRNRDHAREFIKQVAVDVFSHAFDFIDNVGLLEWMTQEQSDAGTREEKLKELRLELSEQCERVDWEVMGEGPVAVAEHLQGVAKASGLELPQDWLERAKGFEHEK